MTPSPGPAQRRAQREGGRAKDFVSVLDFERCEGGDHLTGAIAQRSVAPDQIRVHVGECDAFPGQPALGEQVEEDGAAPQECLDVAVEPDRVEGRERRKKLALTSGPFEQGPGVRGGRLREHLHTACIDRKRCAL